MNDSSVAMQIARNIARASSLLYGCCIEETESPIDNDTDGLEVDDEDMKNDSATTN